MNFSQAIQQGHRASIAEEERPGVFSLRVGNLMPGDVATVQLTLVGILPYRDGEVTFRFPLVVAPRYIPGVPLSGPSVGAGTAVDTNATPDASRISPPVLLPGFPNPVRLSLTLDVYEPADDLRVSLFTVFGEEHGSMRRLLLQPGERLDRDFILRFRLGGETVRTSLSLHPDAAKTGEGTFALTIVPPALQGGEPLGQQPRDVVLVLDRSGSMEGWKMVAARRAIARMVDSLVDVDSFAVLAFDDRIESPPFGGKRLDLIPATDRNRFKAVEFLAKLESRGGTEMAEPVDQAVKLFTTRGPDRDRILVLVTDGQVGNEDQVLGMLGARLQGIRVFALGIDRAVNEGFLRRLVELGQGGGTCELVESEDRLDVVMDAIHRRIGTPVMTDVCLEPAASGLEVVASALVPDRPPSLFAGSPLLLLGRYRGRPHGPVEVCGNTPHSQVWREAIVPCVRDNPALAAAWARGQVRQLEDRYAAARGDRSELERTIIATSLRFGVLCRFTAYVAVDRAAVVNEGGEVHQITQPVEMPEGWGGANVVMSARSAAPLAMQKLAVGRSLQHPGVCATQMFETRASIQDFRLSPPPPTTHAAIRLDLQAEMESPSPVSPPPEDPFKRAGITLLEKIGEDGHGRSYRGQDRGGRRVLIWELKSPVTLASSGAYRQLEKELKRLKHAGIVPILKLIGDARTGQVFALVTENVSELTLTHWLSQGVLSDLRQAAFFVLVLADALEYAAGRLLIHGSLTPGAILIGDDGQPRITGFGLAKLGCGPDVSCATVRAYIAPELLRSPGDRPTAQTDVFSLGVIFYRLLTGALPDSGPGNEHPRPPRAIKPDVPVELEAICLKAVAADPAARYATAGELAADLRKFLGIKKRGLLGQTSKAWSEPRTTKPQKTSRRFWK